MFASQRLFGDVSSKLSYLGGVRLRCGYGDTLSFANSPHKVELVRQLLIELGCQAVEVRRTPRGHYPMIATVTYRPSPPVAAMFDRVDREIEAAKL